MAAFDTSADLMDYIPDVASFVQNISFDGEDEKQLVSLCTKLCQKLVSGFEGRPD